MSTMNDGEEDEEIHSSSDNDDDAPLLPPVPSSASGDRVLVRSSSRGSRSGSNRRSQAPSPSSSPAAHAAVGRQQRASPAPLRLSSPPLTRLAEHAPAVPADGSSVGIGVGIGSSSPRTTPVSATPPDGGNTGPSYTYHDLVRRPRSNPRTRTPLRNESPLAPDFRRDAPNPQGRAAAAAAGSAGAAGGRGVIRIGAGAAVGTVGAGSSRSIRRIGTDQQQPPAVQPRSTKQGPSRRKVRRWNNDKFVGVASELARSASNRSAAEAFLRGEAEASEYLRPNCPLRYRSAFDSLTRSYDEYDEDGEIDGEAWQVVGKKKNDLEVVRDRFVKGETASPTRTNRRSGGKSARRMEEIFNDGRKMFDRVEPRTKAVVTRAVASSSFATKVLDAFEIFLVGVSDGEESTTERVGDLDAVLDEVLVRAPAVATKSSKARDGSTKAENNAVVHFYFNPNSSKGGFHRLLLHAVCQFHGLKASSRTVGSSAANGLLGPARQLSVAGVCRGRGFRLVDYAMAEGGVAESVASDRNETGLSFPAATSRGFINVVPSADQVLEPLSTLRVS